LALEALTLAERTAELENIVEEADGLRYGWFAFLKDSLLPVIDLGCDVGSFGSYVALKQWQYLSLVLTGMFFNAAASTYMLSKDLLMEGGGQRRICALCLNVATLGMSGLVREAQNCSRSGMKSMRLIHLKTHEMLESIASLSVAAYNLVIPGFVPGYEYVGLTTNCFRWATVVTSLATIPLVAYDNVIDMATKDWRSDLRSFRSSVEWKWRGVALGKSFVLAYQVFEIMAQLVYMPLQMALRPWGIFILLGVQWVLLTSVIGPLTLRIKINSASTWMQKVWITISFCCFEVPPMMAFSTLPLPFSKFDLGPVISVVVRFCALSVAWTVLLVECDRQPKLASHLCEPNNIAMLVLAAFGGVGYVTSLLQQWRAGRWENALRHAGVSRFWSGYVVRNTSTSSIAADDGVGFEILSHTSGGDVQFSRLSQSPLLEAQGGM